MPELPDLYVYTENLRKQLLNKEIIDVKTFAVYKINVDSQIFIEALKDSTIINIVQDGKEIIFTLSNGNSFLVHLMSKGIFTINQKQINTSLFNKIASIYFDDETILTISDDKRLAKIELNPEKKLVPDALSEGFSLSYFQSLVSKSPRKNIKALLVDQKKIRGIGNGYVDEILYNAKISPKSKTGKIPEKEIELLYSEIGKTLRWGIESIKINSPNTISGEQRDFFKVHNKKIKQTEKWEKIMVEKVASKETYYTFSQKLYQ